MEKREITSNFRRQLIVSVGAAALLALAFVVVARAGGPPWKTKPFEQWTQNDVSEILRSSPWAKTENVPADWKPSQFGAANPQGGSAPMTGAAPSMGGSPAGAAGANGGAARGSADEDQEQNRASQGQVTYYLRWNSSRTVREALVRDAILGGKIKESDAGKYLSAPITDYEVVVIGPDMTPFGHVSEDELKAKAYLRGKQSKVKVGATNVQINRSSDGRQVTAVMFSFPRKTADGKDVAAPQEKGLQFVLNVKDLDLNTTFDPRKMADQKGPDF